MVGGLGAMYLLCLLSLVTMRYPHASANLIRADRNMQEAQRNCDVEKIRAPAATWPFPSHLTCELTKSRNPFDGTWKPTLACNYTYRCPLDPIGPYRLTRMQCKSNGRWYGKMPDCSTDKLIRYVTFSTMANNSNKKRASILTRSIYKQICKAQKICQRFPSVFVCQYLRSNTRSSLRWNTQELRNLCTSCHLSFCKTSVKIL